VGICWLIILAEGSEDVVRSRKGIKEAEESKKSTDQAKAAG
jgi:hypothetical protein